MWQLHNDVWQDETYPCVNLVSTRICGDLRDVERRREFCHKHALDAAAVVTSQQVHGIRVAVVNAADRGREVAATDGLIVAEPGISVAIFTADCVPVFLAARNGSVAAVVHAGWRGLHGSIVKHALQILNTDFSLSPADIVALIGPHIQKCCYEVGPELKEQFGIHEEGRFLDLDAIAMRQLQDAGVADVRSNGRCTACEPGMFFSYRRDKTASRLMSLVMLRERT